MADFNPATIMVAELNKRLAASPFVPFSIQLSNGHQHVVPTADHLIVTRVLRRVELEFDNGSILEINPLHIVALQSEPSAA
jgi:hypothetical protein